MAGFGSSNTANNELFGVKLNSSQLGQPVTVVMGCAKTNQNIFWTDGFTASPDGGKKGGGGGGKGGGKGDGQYLYSADVIAGLCAGPILGIGDIWTGQSWLGSPKANESYTIASPYTYSPTNAGSLLNDYGVSPVSDYSESYNDFSSPGATTVSNTTSVPFSKVTYGNTLNSGEYSISPAGVYNFSAADAGKTVTVNYSFLLTTINQQENDLVPAGLTISVSPAYTFESDLGVVYAGTGANEGNAFTRVNGTPTAAGTYKVSGSAPATYRFSAADQGAEVTITYQIQNLNAVGQNESTMLDFTLAEGYVGQSPYSFLSGSYPGAALGYSGIATLLYEPMDLGMGGEIQENSFEVITPGINGGSYANGTPILDCNPVYCMTQVLTNSQWGLGVGAIPFPTTFIDSASWGTAGTASAQSVNASAWNWFAANSFFISPVLDSQDTAASAMSKWLEAGMCAAFVSEGLLKLVPYGDTSQAANGYTWTAPSEYVAALDDTCFIAKDGSEPVTIKRSAWQDAYNTVQVQWDNRSAQYANEITQESDQSLIDRFGSRIEDPQDWGFIHTLPAATFAANMRLKHGTYIRNTYEFTLPFTYSYLEPMDLVTLTTSSVWAAGLNNTNLGVTNLPVRITKVVDDPAEGIKIEAEDYPFGAGQPTLFNKGQSAAEVVSNAYASPGTSEVVLFEAMGRLTNYAGNQIWIGACGTSENYGSTNVWVSQDNVNYVQVATIEQPAVIGELASTFSTGSDPDTTNSLVVQLVENSAALVSGTTQAADNDTMLCYVGGEVISYSAAALTSQNTYTLNGYIRRGQLGTTISSHAAGSQFLRLDGSIVKYTYDPSWNGKTVYFKFQAVNSFGNNPQPLSNLSAVSFTIGTTNSEASGLVLNGGLTGKWWRTTGTSGANPVPSGGGDMSTAPLFTTKDIILNYVLNIAGGAVYSFANEAVPPTPPDGLGWQDVYARWTGYFEASATGTYTIGVNSDDGCNLFINGTQLVSNLGNGNSAGADLTYTQSGTIYLVAGTLYPITLEYQNTTDSGALQLLWTLPGASSASLMNVGAVYQSANTLAYSNGSTVATTQGVAMAGASESIVPNGTFILGNSQGWSYTISPGRTGTASYDTANTRILLPSTLLTSATTQSFQVVPGQKYRIAFDLAADDSTHSGVYLRLTYSATNSPNIPEGTETDFSANGTISGTRNTYLYDWTCPSGIYYASLTAYNWLGNAATMYVYGITCVPYAAVGQWGADVTSSNTSANTNNVGSVSSTAVSSTVLPSGGINYLNSNNANFPLNTSNLIKAGIFENGSSGAWGLPVVSVSGQAQFTKAVSKTSRDSFETGNTFPVSQGQILYAGASLNTQGSGSTPGILGVMLTGSSGTNWFPIASLGQGQGWTYATGMFTVPGGFNQATPWLQLNYDGDGSQTLLAADLYLGYTPASGLYKTSTAFIKQGGMIQTGHAGIFNYSASSSTISVWSSAESLPFPDGSTINVPATGSAGSPGWTFSGLSASTTYYLSGYYIIASNTVVVILSDVNGGTSPPSAVQQIQVINADGNIGLNTGFTASTAAPGGSGGGTIPPPPTCPADDQAMESLETGFVPAIEIVAGMHIRDAEGGWNLVHEAWSEDGPLHHVTVLSPDGETETYHVDLNHRWLVPGGDSLADIYSDNWVRSETLSVGDGVQGADGEVHHVSAISEPHPGRYRKIICERHRMRLGKLIAHNFLTYGA